MSQENKEGSEDLDDRLSNLTETSTSSTCSSTTTSSGTTDSDNIVGSERLHIHRQCQSTGGLLHKHEETNECRLANTQSIGLDDVLNFAPKRECDTKPKVNCSSTTKSTTSSKDLEEVRKYCECFTKTYEPTKNSTSQNSTSKLEASLLQKSQASQSNSASTPQLDKSESERLLALNREQNIKQTRSNLTANNASVGSSYSNLVSTSSNSGSTSADTVPKHTLKPAPPPTSLSNIDTNNNKNSTERESILSKRTNFSKSASGSRLIIRGRPNVCDCLTQDCGEKKHSNRRQFIEHYYNSRTQLPSSNTSSSSFNISTPLNRLSECDAITKRLLSSPIRTTNLVESPTRRVQITETDKSRRASLGTNSLTDQVFLFTSSPFKSMESSYRRATRDEKIDNQRKPDLKSTKPCSEIDVRTKQQQGRSLSVCDEETLNPRFRNTSSNHSSNLNRAISLACESNPSPLPRRLLTLIPLFGCDIKSLEQFTKLGLILPPVIDSAVDHIITNGINSIGIFRKSGVRSRINTLRQRIEGNQNLKLDELNRNNEFSIYDIADLIKMWFRELKPVPLMTKELIKLITGFLGNTSTNTPQSLLKRGNSSQQDGASASNECTNITSRKIDSNLRARIDSITTPTHRALLLRALNFLAQISSRCEHNQMTSQNLAICLTPSLCETKTDTNSILLDQKALEYCIDNHRLLFARSCRQ